MSPGGTVHAFDPVLMIYRVSEAIVVGRCQRPRVGRSATLICAFSSESGTEADCMACSRVVLKATRFQPYAFARRDDKLDVQSFLAGWLR